MLFSPHLILHSTSGVFLGFGLLGLFLWFVVFVFVCLVFFLINRAQITEASWIKNTKILMTIPASSCCSPAALWRQTTPGRGEGRKQQGSKIHLLCCGLHGSCHQHLQLWASSGKENELGKEPNNQNNHSHSSSQHRHGEAMASRSTDHLPCYLSWAEPGSPLHSHYRGIQAAFAAQRILVLSAFKQWDDLVI